MDKNEWMDQLDNLCTDLKAKYPEIDIATFKPYVAKMIVQYLTTKVRKAKSFEIQKGKVQLPGKSKCLVVACMYVSAGLLDYSISYNDLYSISHIDRNSIRKCEKDIREVLCL